VRARAVHRIRPHLVPKDEDRAPREARRAAIVAVS